MSSTSGPTIGQLKIILCTLVPIACLVTYFRLWVRQTRGKLWWDDFWAFISTICAIIFVVVIMLHVKDPTTISQNAKIAIYYMCAQFFYAVTWTARISILFTVVRMSFGKLRTWLFVVAIAFFITWSILFAQVWWVCEREKTWKTNLVPQCMLGNNVAIAQVVADVISDAILITAPIKILLGARLTRVLKIRLISVFATTSITTAVSLYHAYAVLRVGGLVEIVAATAQLSISLLVANLGVVVAFIFNLKHDKSTDNTTPVAIRTFGKGSPRNRGETTFITSVAVDTAIQVDIDKPHQWHQSMTAVDKSRGTDEVELNDMSTKMAREDLEAHR